ncbi:hypothetical protein [Rhodococcus sp. ENV425]|uniref:hypothetical protein n=1 Tax=Rhodococcus sp. ENV425 TaxID=2042960 RepID=UPI0011AF36F6|nr:hypothetical protein [Rhodococcus sp. ENV425]
MGDFFRSFPTPAYPSPSNPDQAEAAGANIGRLYGRFQADVEKFFSVMEKDWGGAKAWDLLSPAEKEKILSSISGEYGRLPRLPAVPDRRVSEALKLGFRKAFGNAYLVTLVEFHCVLIMTELLREFAVTRAATGVVAKIGGAGAASYVKNINDCAAHTASIAYREMIGIEVSAEWLARTSGLPQAAYASTGSKALEFAQQYALNWFTRLGFKIATKSGGFATVREGGVIGRYVVFYRGAHGTGHVVYGEVTSDGLRIVDGQLGKVWYSVNHSQSSIGEILKSYRIESIKSSL